ncbi:YdbH domain-containing protein [Erythrobacter sp. YJ-T3-07]|uniref:intermembrane phospholipid transport protein YdbH family protein n=1 Tax=Erythrobacter sp. YJ-T3-07 TaxID=2793063 RepID=UPI0018D492B7|nr:YdbH domain-containing protein [Erythrobacter sp. YJ-T3-07]MBH1943671.1 YdbH domain-containing protein [Erythrobacter sp. YJ-T3-07]
MEDSAEADLAAGEGEEGARPSSRWRRLRPGRRAGYTLVALAALLVIALTIAWFSRERIADDVIQGQLDQYDLPATYDIESIGPNRQVLRNIVVGDPADPDLTVARAIVDLRVRPWGTRFGRVTLEKPRLKGTLGEGGISFGTLDRVLFRDTGGEGGLPELDLKIIDGRARIGGAYGDIALGLVGEGRLDGGFAGRYDLRADALDYAGCGLSNARSKGRIGVDGGKPTLRGPLRVAEIACEDPAVQVVDLSSPVMLVVDDTLDGLEVQVDGKVARLSAPSLAAGSSTIQGALALRGGQTSLHYDLRLGNARTTGLAARWIGAKGVARRGRDTGWRVQTSLAGEGLSPSADWLARLRDWQVASKDTLAAPLIARLREALSREARGSSLAAEVTLTTNADGFSLGVPTATLDGASGARILSLSRFAVLPTQGALPRVSGNFTTAGPGIPVMQGRMERSASGRLVFQLAMEEYRAGEARLAIPQLAVAQAPGGTIGLAGAIQASGPLPGGFARGLSLPIKGSYDGNRLALWPDCTRVSFGQLVYANLALDQRTVTLCPAKGRPILTAAGGAVQLAAGAPSLDLSGTLADTPIALKSGPVGFAWPGQLSASALDVTLGSGDAARFRIDNLKARLGRDIGGTFSGADIGLAAVPLDLTDTAGEWAYRDGVLALTEGSFLLQDRADPPRFEPLAARGARLRLRDNRIVAEAGLREPESDQLVTNVTVEHDLSSGSGFAYLDVPGIRFGKDLQPDDLTRLAFGVIAQTEGAVTGSGKIEWGADGVTSTGQFSSDGLDFAAAFGPVKGASGTIRFDDLLGLTTAPDQRITVGSVNPGIAVEGGTVQFGVREGQLIAVAGASAPFLGGTITLRNLDINIGAQEERAYVFDITGLDAARLVERLELGNVNATGIFDGSITVLFDAQGNGRIVDGTLVSRPPGGNVAYVGELTYEDLTPIANFAFQALRSLDYERLEVEIEGPLTGEIITRLNFTGVAQGAEADSNFLTRQLASLPIEFRINISAPFFALIQNVRSFFDPAFIRDPRSLGLLSDDGVRLRPVITGEEVRAADEAAEEEAAQKEAARAAAQAGKKPEQTIQHSESEKRP